MLNDAKSKNYVRIGTLGYKTSSSDIIKDTEMLKKQDAFMVSSNKPHGITIKAKINKDVNKNE